MHYQGIICKASKKSITNAHQHLKTELRETRAGARELCCADLSGNRVLTHWLSCQGLFFIKIKSPSAILPLPWTQRELCMRLLETNPALLSFPQGGRIKFSSFLCYTGVDIGSLSIGLAGAASALRIAVNLCSLLLPYASTHHHFCTIWKKTKETKGEITL